MASHPPHAYKCDSRQSFRQNPTIPAIPEFQILLPLLHCTSDSNETVNVHGVISDMYFEHFHKICNNRSKLTSAKHEKVTATNLLLYRSYILRTCMILY